MNNSETERYLTSVSELNMLSGIYINSRVSHDIFKYRDTRCNFVNGF